MMTLRLLMTLLTLVIFAGVPGALQADEARVGNAVAKLFDVGWSTSAKSRTEAEYWFTIAEQYEPGDPRTNYAFALVQMKHRNYKGALQTIENILATDKENVAAQKAQIWMAMITKNFTTALAGMERLSQQLPEALGEDLPSVEHRDIAAFLGRMFGFLEGPANGAIGDIQLSISEGKIGPRLLGPLEGVFEESRRSVEDQFASITRDQIEEVRKAKTDSEKERLRLLADLKKREDQIAQRRKEIQPERDKIIKESQSELDRIAAEDRPLADQLSQLETQASFLQTERFRAANEASRFQGLLARERNNVLRSGFSNEMIRLSVIADRYTLELNQLGRRADVIARQRFDIQRRHAIARNNAALKIKTLDAELADLKKQERRLTSDKKKANRPAKGVSTRSRALASQAAAFTTYETFPLEAEKERLLEMFR